jgi:hypothetical protein
MLVDASHVSDKTFYEGHGATRVLSDETFRNGQQSVVALDIIALIITAGGRPR